MHFDTPRLTPLSYFLIAGFQPKGRTVVVHLQHTPMMTQAAQIILQTLAGKPANA
jgi:hypothetical protein